MDLAMWGKGLGYAKQNKRWAVVLGAIGLTTYVAYKAYSLPGLVEKRQRLLKLLGAFLSLSEMAAVSAETIGVVSKDVKEFLQSNCDHIPQSIKQISKIAKSDEFLASIVMVTRSLAVGILGAEKSLPNRIVDKLVSDAGRGFTSVVVGSFARNLVIGLMGQGSCLDDFSNRFIPRWVEFTCQEDCREVIGDCIRVFVTTAVTVYLEKTININTYNEFFSGLTNPKHAMEVRALLAYVSKGAVETFIQKCYSIWAAKLEMAPGYNENEKGLQARKLTEKKEKREWPHRKFVMDITGLMTFETVRAFLELLLEKLQEFIKRSADIFQRNIVNRGIQAASRVTRKSRSVTTMCFNMCLNILDSPWILVPQ